MLSTANACWLARFFNKERHNDTRHALKLEYEAYLGDQRDLSDRTIYHCWRFADRFPTFRFKARKPGFGKVKAGDIADFLEQLATHRKPFRDKTPPAQLLPILLL